MQLAKALSQIAETFLGMIILLSAEQRSNAPAPITSADFDILTSMSDLHPSKVYSSINSTLSGIIIFLSCVHPSNADLQIVLTLSGIMIF